VNPRIGEIERQLHILNRIYRGRALPPAAREKWNRLNAELIGLRGERG